jgi:hypothetical protein
MVSRYFFVINPNDGCVCILTENLAAKFLKSCQTKSKCRLAQVPEAGEN